MARGFRRAEAASAMQKGMRLMLVLELSFTLSCFAGCIARMEAW